MDYQIGYKNLYLSTKQKYTFLQEAMNQSETDKINFIVGYFNGGGNKKKVERGKYNNLDDSLKGLKEITMEGQILHCYDESVYSTEVHKTHGLKLCSMGVAETATNLLTNIKKHDYKDSTSVVDDILKIIDSGYKYINKIPNHTFDDKIISITTKKLEEIYNVIKELPNKIVKHKEQVILVDKLLAMKSDELGKFLHNYSTVEFHELQVVKKTLSKKGNDEAIKELNKLKSNLSKKYNMGFENISDINKKINEIKIAVNDLLNDLKSLPTKIKEIKNISDIKKCSTITTLVERDVCFKKTLDFMETLEPKATALKTVIDSFYANLALNIYIENKI